MGKNPTDRGKNGTKRSLLVEAQGGPLAVVIAPANVNDQRLLRATLEAIIVDRPPAGRQQPQHLCLDAAYDNPTGREVATEFHYTAHIRPVKKEAPVSKFKRQKPRRWVVERTAAWLSKCRAILVRYDKYAENYLGLLQLACGLLWYRRLHRFKVT